jgi:hypothetical protein
VNAEPGPWQCTKSSIGNDGPADFALTVTASLHSFKGDIDVLKSAPFAIQVSKDEMSRQIAVGLGAFIIRLMFQECLGPLCREAR